MKAIERDRAVYPENRLHRYGSPIQNEHSPRTSLRLDVVVDLVSGRLDGAIAVGESEQE